MNPFIGVNMLEENKLFYGGTFDFELLIAHRMINRASINIITDGIEQSVGINFGSSF